MGLFSFDQLQEQWSIWEVRSFMLFSLFLQSVLILVSPFRTKTANGIIYFLLCLVYLLADWVVLFAVGLISLDLRDTPADKTNGDLLAFWAPILIIHAGGPDTITALTLEDNELWTRQLIPFYSQLSATAFVLYKSSTRDSELLAPTSLVFFVGLIKYGQRVYSFYLASVTKFRGSLLTKPDARFNYDEDVRELNSAPGFSHPDTGEFHVLQIKSGLSATDEDRSDIEMVQDAYKWFTKFMGVVADAVYSKDDWHETRGYFRERNAEQAFRVVEIELNFIYEALYTKMWVIRTWVGSILRLVCFVLVFVSFFLWRSIHESRIPPRDVKITYALLAGPITLDVIAFFMLIFSDWSIANVMKSIVGPEDESQQNNKSICRYQLRRLINRYLAISDRRWSGYSESNRTALSKSLSRTFCFWRSSAAEAKAEGEERTIPLLVIASRIFCRRWSESVQQFNLIDYGVNQRSAPVEKVCGWVGLTDFLDRVQYVSIRWFSESLRDSIFSELKAKSETMGSPEDAHKICEARGEWVLENKLSSFFINWKVLKPWLTYVHFDESLILWHIATEICYNQDIQKQVEEDDDDASKQNLPTSWHEEKEIEQQKGGPDFLRQENDIEQQKGPETDQEEEDGKQQKGTQTDLEEEDDEEKQKGLVTLEKEDDVEQQLSSSEIQECQENAAKQQEGDKTMEEEKGHVTQQESTPAANEKDDVERQQNNPAKEKVSQQKTDREVAKTLSDYMLYLLTMQPKIMTAVAGIDLFRSRATSVDTCSEAKKFLRILVTERNEKERVRTACSKLLEVSPDIFPNQALGPRSKSMLFEGCSLAKVLDEKLGDKKWIVIHKVWVEMLSYAATHCGGNTHAAQLGKGGQLITFVWMLMVHLGLGKQFEMIK